MLRNIEIKAKVKDIDALLQKAEKISTSEKCVLKQEDTFFQIPLGRLKLRTFENNSSELIFYDRPNSEGPKLSEYCKAHVEDTQNMKVCLSKALGIKGMVKKVRTLYMVGQTRVHVDQVEQLGNFMELEVVLSDNQTLEDGQLIAQDLMDKLGIENEDLLSHAYMDLILSK